MKYKKKTQIEYSLSQVTPPALPKRELIPVSTAWTDEECYYSPLDWMPVHQKATPPPQPPRISSGFYDNFLVSINSWFEKAYWNKGARSTSGLVVVTVQFFNLLCKFNTNLWKSVPCLLLATQSIFHLVLFHGAMIDRFSVRSEVLFWRTTPSLTQATNGSG